MFCDVIIVSFVLFQRSSFAVFSNFGFQISFQSAWVFGGGGCALATLLYLTFPCLFAQVATLFVYFDVFHLTTALILQQQFVRLLWY